MGMGGLRNKRSGLELGRIEGRGSGSDSVISGTHAYHHRRREWGEHGTVHDCSDGWTTPSRHPWRSFRKTWGPTHIPCSCTGSRSHTSSTRRTSGLGTPCRPVPGEERSRVGSEGRGGPPQTTPPRPVPVDTGRQVHRPQSLVGLGPVFRRGRQEVAPRPVATQTLETPLLSGSGTGDKRGSISCTRTPPRLRDRKTDLQPPLEYGEGPGGKGVDALQTTRSGEGEHQVVEACRHVVEVVTL